MAADYNDIIVQSSRGLLHQLSGSLVISLHHPCAQMVSFYSNQCSLYDMCYKVASNAQLNNNNDDDDNVGIITGAVIGGLVVVAILLVLIIYLVFKYRKR